MKDFRKGGIVGVDKASGNDQPVFLQGRNSELFINGRKYIEPQIDQIKMSRSIKGFANYLVAKAEAQRLATKAQCYAKASCGLGFHADPN